MLSFHLLSTSTLILVGVIAAVVARIRFRRWVTLGRQRWTASLPLARPSRISSIRIPALFPLALFLLSTASLAPWAPESAAALAAAASVGSLLGLVWPIGHAAAYPPSRYRPGRPQTHWTPDLQPLAADLSVATAARLQPRTLARIIVPMLLLAPAGIEPTTAVLLVLFLSAVVYLDALLGGLRDCVADARTWSASLPVDPLILRRHWRSTARRRSIAPLAVLAVALLLSYPVPRIAAILILGILVLEALQAWTLRR